MAGLRTKLPPGSSESEDQSLVSMSALASLLASSDSPQVKLVHKWGLAFEKKNLDLIAELLHKDYRHTTYPRSLGKPEKTREEWLEHIAGVISLRTEQDVSRIQSCYQLPFNSPWLNPSRSHPSV